MPQNVKPDQVQRILEDLHSKGVINTDKSIREIMAATQNVAPQSPSGATPGGTVEDQTGRWYAIGGSDFVFVVSTPD